jgi:glucokinase
VSDVMVLIYLGIKGQLSIALWTAASGMSPSETYAVSDEDAFEAAVLSYLDSQGAPFISAAAISAPGWELGGIQYMPNHGYNLDRDRLRKILNIKRVHLVNPTVARALAIPHIGSADMFALNPGSMDQDDMAKCIIGTGPGLGMAILLKDDQDQWTAFSGAGGHSDLTVFSDEEFEIRQRLHAELGHVSRESAVSLGGLCRIWLYMAQIDGVESAQLPAFETVFALAGSGDARALRAIQMVIKWLAKAASDMALFSGARGGVYLTGQLVEGLLPYIDRDGFCEQFIKHAKIDSYLSDVPVYVITAKDADFRGLITLFS